VTYTVHRCNRAAIPGQPGCESFFTTDAPALVGPISLGADYIIQAQTSPNVIVISNRLEL
jgi:hypothetical protein